jgi:hypothetical protein
MMTTLPNGEVSSMVDVPATPPWHCPIGVIGCRYIGAGTVREHMTADLIELDERGRAPLRKYGRPKGRYLVEVDEDGVIHLYPAAVMTELEVAMWRHRPEDAARIDASLANPGQLVEVSADEL